MTHRLAFAIAAAAAAGCIGIKSNPGQDKVDAAPKPPDAPPDAAPDALPDAPDVVVPHHYIIDKQFIPTSAAMSRDLGLDLNGDTTIDNQLGMVMGVFASQGLPIQETADPVVDRGASLMLIDLQSNGFTSGTGKFTLYTGANPQPPACNGGADVTCRRHLDGNGAFIVSVASARDPLLTGTFSSGTLTTAVGPTNRLHLSTALMTAPPETLELLGARVKVTGASATGITSGVIAGAVPATEVNTKLLPGWQTGINAQIAQDCTRVGTDCGCTNPSTGRTYVLLFDLIAKDCIVSMTELTTSSLIQALLEPDVTIDGQPALSLGIGFRAVRATYTP
jgi:hypothetical protein